MDTNIKSKIDGVVITRLKQIPPGLWYGFSCISESPALLANCADYPHDPQESETQPLGTPRIYPING